MAYLLEIAFFEILQSVFKTIPSYQQITYIQLLFLSAAHTRTHWPNLDGNYNVTVEVALGIICNQRETFRPFHWLM
jgi:hypothetical protein